MRKLKRKTKKLASKKLLKLSKINKKNRDKQQKLKLNIIEFLLKL